MERAKINVLKSKGLGERRNLRMRMREHGCCWLYAVCCAERLRSFGFVEDDEVSE